MVQKKIRFSIIEISIVILLVVITIPIWQGFNERFSKSEVVDITDLKIDFSIYDNNQEKIIMVYNGFNVERSYSIYISVKDNVNTDLVLININGVDYKLDDFYKTKDGVYKLVDKEIKARKDVYVINTNISDEGSYKIYYEENDIF